MHSHAVWTSQVLSKFATVKHSAMANIPDGAASHLRYRRPWTGPCISSWLRRGPARAGGTVARRIRSSARLKFLCRSSISAHSHHTVARSSTYLNLACSTN